VIKGVIKKVWWK